MSTIAVIFFGELYRSRSDIDAQQAEGKLVVLGPMPVHAFRNASYGHTHGRATLGDVGPLGPEPRCGVATECGAGLLATPVSYSTVLAPLKRRVAQCDR